jgi:glutaminase
MRIEEAQGQTGRQAARVVSSPLVEILERVHRELAADTAGRVATYIPELGQSDPRTFGIAVATVDGQVFDVGDARQAFTIQSISKPLVFGMALEECGKDVVLGRVGVEPSGNPFNSVTVDPRSSRPFNPMVNAGAIVTTALLGGADPSERFERLLASTSRMSSA